jgi:hypothetical protein
LVRDPSGRLDPGSPINQAWLQQHQAGDVEHSALDELLARWRDIRVDPAFADRVRDELVGDAARVVLAAALCALPGELANIQSEIAALRAEVAALQTAAAPVLGRPAGGL